MFLQELSVFVCFCGQL